MIPIVFNGVFGANVSFGGTSIIIIVGVVLETLKQIESQMLVRYYKGFSERLVDTEKSLYGSARMVILYRLF